MIFSRGRGTRVGVGRRIRPDTISGWISSLVLSCYNGRCLLIAQVSWIRQRDLHILTVGILTYTNDQRFQSLHSDGSDEWTLKISSPQVRDSGIYECQVSTEPKISQAFNLSVVGTCASLSLLFLFTADKIQSIAIQVIPLWLKPLKLQKEIKSYAGKL